MGSLGNMATVEQWEYASVRSPLIGSTTYNALENWPPEAVELLAPLQRNKGYVFTPLRKDGKPLARHMLKISKIICSIGSEAKVLVEPATKKTASAHDLRRAFGYRWSRLVKTTQLKELMRHASIETTLTYYVGENAESTAEELWSALGDKLGDKQVVIEKENSKTP